MPSTIKKLTCEICQEEVTAVDKHHIHSKSMGGSNFKWNIAKICPNCHRTVHMGLVIIEGRFFTSNGDLLLHRKKGEESITGTPDPPCHIIGA